MARTCSQDSASPGIFDEHVAGRSTRAPHAFTRSSARSLITLTGVLQAAYAAAFALRDPHPSTTLLVALGFLLLALFWLVSLLFATAVFVPHMRLGANLNDLTPQQWMEVKRTIERASKRKLTLLHWAHGFLGTSFVAAFVLLALIVYRTPGATQWIWP